jgi:hypothetical protein
LSLSIENKKPIFSKKKNVSEEITDSLSKKLNVVNWGYEKNG